MIRKVYLPKDIELAFGRSLKKSASIKDRPIDIDIINYEGKTLQQALQG